MNFLLFRNIKRIEKKTLKQRGYTLIELLLVIVIVAIMMSITMPRFRLNILTDDLKSTTRKLIGTIKNFLYRIIAIRLDSFAVRCLKWRSMRSGVRVACLDWGGHGKFGSCGSPLQIVKTRSWSGGANS